MARMRRIGGKREVMTDKRVLAVVVSYNRCDTLLRCIACLLAQEGAACDILIVDNASTDGTREAVAALEDDRIRYHDTGKNIGGAGGFNAGMRMGVEMGYTHLWIMDDDTLANPDSLKELLDAEDVLPNGYGFLSSVALWTDGGECRMNRPKLRKSFLTESPLLKYGLVLCNEATFVSLFIRTQTVREVGLPIKDYFIWGDDIEYTRRISVRKKIPSYVAGRSQVTHLTKDNIGSSIALDKGERIARYNYAFRNENYTYRMEGIRGFAYYTAKCALNIGRIILRAKNKRMRRIWIIVSQYVRGLFFNPRIEYIQNTDESGAGLCSKN